MTDDLKIEKALPGDFEQIYPLLLDFNNPKISKAQWQRLFADYWHFQPDYCGYKLLAGNETVGFIAYILSQKYINGHWEKVCNISSWIVKPEYRNSSIDLLYPLLDLKDHTIISFTPTEGALKVETKLFKFKIFDRFEVIMPAVPSFAAPGREKFKILTSRKHPPQLIHQYLNDYEKKISQDHESFDCDHVVLTSGQENAYLVFKKIHKRHLPFAKLYYTGNLEFFLHHLETLRWRIPIALKTVGIVVDSRFLKDKQVPFKKNKDFYMPMLYKSERLQPHDIDYLYSEFFLLGA